MTNAEIIARPDGSIDTAYYMTRGRKMRSEQAHALIKGTVEQAKEEGMTVILATKRPSWFRRALGLAT